ncbi:MAG TPA: AMP-binding protein [Conexibacter sp.]|jgi:acyl-CoA synthetase (AMP-forming)/AMP-acid ligase II
MRVPDLLAHASRRYPDKRCVAVGGRELTFAAADARAARFAALLHARGVGDGRRVALLALNELEYLEIRVGAQRAGAILVPLNYRLSEPELKALLEDCEPDLLIVSPEYADLGERVGAAELLVLGDGGSYAAALSAAAPLPRPDGLAAEQAGLICYTSGTTSRPKGVLLSNWALHATTMQMAQEIGATPYGVYLAANPLFHIGHTVGFAFAYCGGTHLQLRKFDADAYLELLTAGAFTHGQLVPAMIQTLLERTADARGGALQRLLYGAAPMAPELASRTLAAWGCELVNGYGSTEAMGISMLPPEDHDPQRRPHLLASVGRSSPGMTARVIDEEGRDAPAGAVGEVIARGPNLMSGYWRNDDATAAALRDGWMHTGDLGYRDDDGYLFLVDRRNDKIVTGGENVYPTEVEHALAEHPAVREAAVVGVANPRWGEQVTAVVVTRDGFADDAALIAHCRTRLAGYKTPKQVVFAAELPRTSTGKLLRRELRQQLAAATAAPAAPS